MQEQIAIYWDFENVHASLYDLFNGAGSYRQNRFTRQPDIVNVVALMNFVLPIGRVAVNKAYANWTWFSAYAGSFMNHTIDLIQLFPRGAHAKNGADIRMCVDIVEDINSFPYIGKVVIVGGDSDYIAVGQKLRQKGKEVIGIGVRESTNRFWIAACNEFKFYDNLVKVPGRPTSDPVREIEADVASDMTEGKGLLVNAVSRITSLKSEPFARMSSLKQTMLQLDSAFDEANYGYHTFADFVNGCSDIVNVQQGPHEKQVYLRDSAPVNEVSEAESPHEYYKRILRQQQFRLLPGAYFIPLCDAVCLADVDGPFASWDDFLTRVADKVQPPLSTQLSDTDLSRLKQMLFKSCVFRFHPTEHTIALVPDLSSPSALVKHVFRNTINRLLSYPDLRWDPKLIAELLFGDAQHESEVNAWYEDLKTTGIQEGG